MRVYLRDGSAKTILRAATLRYKLQTKLSISPSDTLLTPGQPVPALTLKRQAPGRVATGAGVRGEELRSCGLGLVSEEL